MWTGSSAHAQVPRAQHLSSFSHVAGKAEGLPQTSISGLTLHETHHRKGKCRSSTKDITEKRVRGKKEGKDSTSSNHFLEDDGTVHPWEEGPRNTLARELLGLVG